MKQDNPAAILNELVERFENNIEDYKTSKYDEENTKIDFIDKFFELLGWDVYNSIGASEDYREVKREDRIEIKGRPKSPDYSFKIGNERQFFVEAKKPSVNIHDDKKPAFQLRRYAFTAGLPISILTNFEEFAIYDTTVMPNEDDKASIARIFYCKFNEYDKNWEFFNKHISKQAVLQGKLKKYAIDNKTTKGNQTIDKELLKLIEEWRFNLAKNIALRNKEIDIYQLNESVQMIIDRIIFLRMAEDRNTEIYGTLRSYSVKDKIYNLLTKYFDSANKKYNSGLFANVKWLDNLTIDNNILKMIIENLYYPMPFEFSVLPIEILGQIYEQFLGKTITLSNRHVADVIDKPEVRKAGGVYYTPKYIVDYIIENTVGKKIGVQSLGDSVQDSDTPNPIPQTPKTMTPKEIENLTILDPACGSGSFLVGAYKYLLNFHIEYYTKPDNIKKALTEGRIYESGNSVKDSDPNTPNPKPYTHKSYSLTIKEKKKILLNNIYGVDIDSQAIEVTKLSLLMTLMEGEIVEVKSELYLKNKKDALLPNLDKNIKCGNSLIGTDFYNDKDLKQFGIDEQRKINCFDWEVEFPHIFTGKKEKFDKEYFEKNLSKGVEKAKEAIDIAKSAYEYTNTAYEYAKEYGIVSEPIEEYNIRKGFDIVIGNPPYVLLENEMRNDSHVNYYKSKYKAIGYKIDLYHIFIEKGINLINNRGIMGFITPSNYLTNNGLMILRNFILNNTYILELNIIKGNVFNKVSVDTTLSFFTKENINYKSNYIISSWDGDSLSVYSKNLFNQEVFKTKYYLFTNTEDVINSKLIINLGDLCFVKFGMQLRDRKEYTFDVINSNEIKKVTKFHRPCYTGKDINRYFTGYSNLLAYYNREAKRGGCWDEDMHNSNPKILIRQVGFNPIACLDINGYCCLNTLFMLIPKNNNNYSILYLIGIINSMYIKYFWKKKFYDRRTTFPKIKGSYLEQLPIKTIDFSNKSEKAKHDRMVSLVEQMLEAQKKAHSDKNITETEKKLARQRINILDKQIDTLVYDLYELTPEEIKIVEGE